MTGQQFPPTSAELIAMRAILVDLVDTVDDLYTALGNKPGYDRLRDILQRAQLLRLAGEAATPTATEHLAGEAGAPHLHTSTPILPGATRAGQ